MTSFRQFRICNRDIQDSCERQVWGSLSYEDGAGAYMKTRGTGTDDEDVPVINVGYSFNLEDDSDAEVIVFATGSDTGQKMVLPCIPHAKQRQWAKGAGGIQDPNNPDRAIEINDKEVWIKDGSIALGANKEVVISVSGGTTTIKIAGGVLNLETTELQHNGVNIGQDHAHTLVTVGAGVSGPPEP